MRSIARNTAAATALAVSLAFVGGAMPADAQQASSPVGYALIDDGRLLTFALDDADVVPRPVRISGIAAGSTIVGIDERPKTGVLYAVTRSNSTGAASIYTVDPTTGRATLAAPLVLATNRSQPIVLTGSEFGVDFNPSADALRIVGDDGQNLRALPSDRVVSAVQRFTGDTFVDSTLSYQPISAPSRPAATGINAAAYTRNLATTASTTLYDIDANRDDLVIQNPPNDGTVVKVADLAIAGRSVRGFDIASTTSTDTGYLALGAGRAGSNRTDLVIVDLGTGALTYVGTIYRGPIIDIAVDTP